MGESAPSTPPELRASGFFQLQKRLLRNPIDLFEEAARQGDVCQLKLLDRRIFLVSHPDFVKRILQENASNYDKQTLGYRRMRELVGNGLVTSDGSFWLRQRRIAQPAFHRQRIAGFVGSMVECTQQLIHEWEAAARSQSTRELTQDMTTLTIQIAGQTLLSADLSSETKGIGATLRAVMAHLTSRMVDPFALPLWVPTLGHLRYRGHLKRLDDVLLGVIDRRQKAAEADRPNDLLSLLVEARDSETGEGMSHTQLRDEVVTLFVAGHETTAIGLTWAFYLIGTHPDVLARIREELKAVLDGRPPEAKDIPRLTYLGQVVNEALRFFPPIPFIGRHVVADDTLGSYKLPKDSFVVMSPFIMHRDARFWRNPAQFDPSHFDSAQVEQRHRFAYFPFAAGPRQCIGNTFAITEMQVVLASLLQRFDVHVDPQQPIPEAKLTLRPKGGVSFRVSEFPGASA